MNHRSITSAFRQKVSAPSRKRNHWIRPVQSRLTLIGCQASGWPALRAARRASARDEPLDLQKYLSRTGAGLGTVEKTIKFTWPDSWRDQHGIRPRRSHKTRQSRVAAFAGPRSSRFVIPFELFL